MRKANVFVNGLKAGILEEINSKHFKFEYVESYEGQPVSLTMPVAKKIFDFDRFPSFFDGLLPEGAMLDAFLFKNKIDPNDYFSQLMLVGKNTVGTVTVEEINHQ